MPSAQWLHFPNLDCHQSIFECNFGLEIDFGFEFVNQECLETTVHDELLGN